MRLALACLFVAVSASVGWTADDSRLPRSPGSGMDDTQGAAIPRWQPRLTQTQFANPSINCFDVRTGTTFPLHATALTSGGAISEDTTALAHFCVGALHAVHWIAISDGDGGAFVAWVQAAGEDCDLRLTRVDGLGQLREGWPEFGVSICAARGTQTQPTLCVDGAGGAWVTWKDYRASVPAIYAAHVMESGALSAGSPVDGRRVRTAALPQSHPVVSQRDGQSVWIVWEEGPSGARNLWADALDLSGEPVAGWPANGRELISSETDDVSPMIAQTPGLGLAVSWKALGSEQQSLRMLAFSNDGVPNPAWPAGGATLATTSLDLALGDLSADSTGFYVSWLAAREDSSDARLQRLTGAGGVAANWPEAGIKLGSAQSRVSEVTTLLPDGLGGTFAAWVEYEDDGEGSVYVGRYGVTGSSPQGWSQDGLRASSMAGEEYHPRLVASATGPLVSWASAGAAGSGTLLSSQSAITGPLPSLQKADAWPDAVELTWALSDSVPYAIQIEKQTAENIWTPLQLLVRNKDGLLRFEDRAVNAGTAVYRLRLIAPALEATMPQLEIVVPASAPLALGRVDLQAGHVEVRFSLPNRTEAHMEIFDVQGRRVFRQLIRVEHSGENSAAWPQSTSLRSGVYFARLTQARESRLLRTTLIR